MKKQNKPYRQRAHACQTTEDQCKQRASIFILDTYVTKKSSLLKNRCDHLSAHQQQYRQRRHFNPQRAFRRHPQTRQHFCGTPLHQDVANLTQTSQKTQELHPVALEDAGPLFGQDVEDPPLPPGLTRGIQVNLFIITNWKLRPDTRTCQLVAPVAYKSPVASYSGL